MRTMRQRRLQQGHPFDSAQNKSRPVQEQLGHKNSITHKPDIVKLDHRIWAEGGDSRSL
jgi:hypothetical protein